MTAAAPPTGASDLAVLADWLRSIVDRQDLNLPPPADERAAALAELLAALSAEFAEYRTIVATARETARRNLDGLQALSRATNENAGHVRTAAAAATEAQNVASRMAEAAETLQRFVPAAAAATDDTGSHIAAFDIALRALSERLADGSAPLEMMGRSISSVSDFLGTLARLSRHAQLLAVNSSIEAAHLGEDGARFEIVAQEVRKLSVSTRDSKADVATIVKELRDSTKHIAAGVGESRGTADSATRAAKDANEALARTTQAVREFEAMLGDLVGAAAQQQKAVHTISSAIDAVARHASEVADAARDAGRTDVERLLERAQAKADGWRLRQGPAPQYAGGDEVGRWIQAILRGDGTSSAPPNLAELAGAVRSLVERADADGREIVDAVAACAATFSDRQSGWEIIREALAHADAEIGLVRDSIAGSVSAAQTVAGILTSLRDIGSTVGSNHRASVTAIEGVMERIAVIDNGMHAIDGFFESMNAAAERAAQIMALIETLSSETDLLSLNAAIEAAHAGDEGHGFSVIAEEIRALARSTNESTSNVTQVVLHIAEGSAALQTSIAAARESTSDVVARSEAARASIAALGTAIETATSSAAVFQSSAGEQTRALEAVRESVNRSAALIGGGLSAADRGRSDFDGLAARAQEVAARRGARRR